MMRLVLALALLSSVASSLAADRVRVGAGAFAPVLAPSSTETVTEVQAFELDRHPVTNAEFLNFVRAYPDWRRGQVAALFADGE